MGTFTGVTASSGAKIKKGCENRVKKLMDNYDFSQGLECQINDNRIEIWGYEWPYLSLKSKNAENNDYIFDDFLKRLSPLLDEDLVIQSIGNEKCVYPLCAMEIIVTPSSVSHKYFFSGHP